MPSMLRTTPCSEMGKPTHAYDLDLLEGGRIIVRLAEEGETLKTLDGVERKLTPEDLVIADAKRPVGLAGVMGGFDTMITDKTRNILIESAWFDPGDRAQDGAAARVAHRRFASLRARRGFRVDDSVLRSRGGVDSGIGRRRTRRRCGGCDCHARRSGSDCTESSRSVANSGRAACRRKRSCGFSSTWDLS